MADGKIVFDTAVNRSGMEKDLNGIRRSTGGLKASLGKIGGLIAAAFSVGKIVQFGKACIDLGSDLAEVQNVVDVTFGSMSEKVDEFAQSALFTAGLSETMAKKYMGTFGAMAKAFGFSTEESYSMSKALTQLSGDVASFYNLSQEEAFTKLKAVFTGETESLKDLGIVMTQAQLDQFAMAQGLGHGTKNMTEQQKVALRYQFVLQQLTLASGDFIRTSDGWANQTRILSVQFQQLKAVIGQGLINALTPALKVINLVISRLMTLAVAFRNLTARIFGNAGGSSGGAPAAGMEAAAGAADDLADSVGGVGSAAKAAKRELAGFDQLNVIGSDAAGGGGGGGASGMPDFSIPEDGGLIDAMTERLEKLNGLNFQPMINAVSALGDSFKGLSKTISGHLKWVWDDILKPFAKWFLEELAPSTTLALSDIIDFSNEVLDTSLGVVQTLWPYLQPVVAWLQDELIATIDNARLSFQKYTQVLSESKDDIKGIFDELGQIFEGLWGTTEPTLENMTSGFRSNLLLIRSIVADCFKGVVGNIRANLMIINGLMTGDWGKIWEGAKKKVYNMVHMIIDLISEFATVFGFKFEDVRESITGSLNGTIGAFNGLISSVCNLFNIVMDIIGQLSFTIPDWIPKYGGRKFQIPTFHIDNYPQIPYLAQGAVLPPNKPFMAMLGDQSHGRNLEAPEDLIRQIVREEGGGANVKVVSLLAEIVELLSQIRDGNGEIDMRKLSRLITKYQKELARVGG